jgi:hypothetical protein
MEETMKDHSEEIVTMMAKAHEQLSDIRVAVIDDGDGSTAHIFPSWDAASAFMVETERPESQVLYCLPADVLDSIMSAGEWGIRTAIDRGNALEGLQSGIDLCVDAINVLLTYTEDPENNVEVVSALNKIASTINESGVGDAELGYRRRTP